MTRHNWIWFNIHRVVVVRRYFSNALLTSMAVIVYARHSIYDFVQIGGITLPRNAKSFYSLNKISFVRNLPRKFLVKREKEIKRRIWFSEMPFDWFFIVIFTVCLDWSRYFYCKFNCKQKVSKLFIFVYIIWNYYGFFGLVYCHINAKV